jgi:hypothetical protein
MTYEKDTETYIIKDLDLYEISVVTLGANDQTEFTGFKSLESELPIDEQIEELLKRLSFQDSMEIRQLINKYINNSNDKSVKLEIEKNNEKIDIKELFSSLKFV